MDSGRIVIYKEASISLTSPPSVVTTTTCRLVNKKDNGGSTDSANMGAKVALRGTVTSAMMLKAKVRLAR